jgi:hypothetical protein
MSVINTSSAVSAQLSAANSKKANVEDTDLVNNCVVSFFSN